MVFNRAMVTEEFSGLQAMAENVPDPRPGPPFVDVDRYFDEPAPVSDSRLTGLLAWSVKSSAAQRSELLKLVMWCNRSPDAERRVILVLMDRYQGRVPGGAVNDIAKLAGCSREIVRKAINRFTEYFPDAISAQRRRVG